MTKNKHTTLTEKILKYFELEGEAPLAGFFEKHPEENEKSVYTLAGRLTKQGLLKRRKAKNESRQLISFFQLSSSGEKRLEPDDPHKPPGEWDGYFRLLIFDIPEEKKAVREHLREELKKRGFYMLQLSVWLTPYPVDQELEQLIQEIGAKYYVRFLVIKEINYEEDIRSFYGL